MTDVALARPTLRAYGVWGEAGYTYGTNGTAPVATKRFTWQQEARTVHGSLTFQLNYYADAVVDARRMNELAYLAERERAALTTLEAMVQAAVDGTAYIGLPHPTQEVTKDIVQVIGEWVAQAGYPDTWAQTIEQTVAGAMARLNQWRERLVAAQARQDPEHRAWGLAAAIETITPREDP